MVAAHSSYLSYTKKIYVQHCHFRLTVNEYFLTLHIDSDVHFCLLPHCIVDYTAVLSSVLTPNTGSAQNS